MKNNGRKQLCEERRKNKDKREDAYIETGFTDGERHEEVRKYFRKEES